MTTRTKIVFLFIVGLAGAVIAIVLALESFKVYTLPTRGGVNVDIKVAVAPPLEAWAREAATQFSNNQVTVEVVALKGLDAAPALKQNNFDAWIAEADFVRQMARDIPFEETGPSVAQTGLVWVEVIGRNKLTGPAGWGTVHDAAVNNPQFHAALPSPSNSVEGLAAYLSAAAFHAQTNPGPDFAAWMDDILIAVPEKTLAPLNQLVRTPPSVDVGLILESELGKLDATQFVPQFLTYNVLFNFPYLIRQGGTPADDTQAADREKAAAQFRDFLLSAEQQNRLAEYSLARSGAPAAGQSVPVDGAAAERLRAQFR